MSGKLFFYKDLVSVIIHAVALFSFAYIKFSEEKKAISEISVAFVGKQKQTILQRKTPIRQLAYSSRTQISDSEQPTYISLNYKAPLGTGANLTNTISSEFGDMGYVMLASPKLLHTDFHQPVNAFIDKPQRLSNWEPAKVKMVNSDGHTLISKGLLEPTLDNEHFSVDLDDVMQRFFTSVRKKIESNKRYPRFARNAGIEGRSGVKITILKDGQLGKVEVVEPSGSEILDNAAMQSIRRASPFPPIPVTLGQDKIELSLYLVFHLTSNI